MGAPSTVQGLDTRHARIIAEAAAAAVAAADVANGEALRRKGRAINPALGAGGAPQRNFLVPGNTPDVSVSTGMGSDVSFRTDDTYRVAPRPPLSHGSALNPERSNSTSGNNLDSGSSLGQSGDKINAAGSWGATSSGLDQGSIREVGVEDLSERRAALVGGRYSSGGSVRVYNSGGSRALYSSGDSRDLHGSSDVGRHGAHGSSKGARLRVHNKFPGRVYRKIWGILFRLGSEPSCL